MSRKTVAKSLAEGFTLQFSGFHMGRIKYDSATVSKHFRFYWTKKHFISEWYFATNHEIGSRVLRKVKRESRVHMTILSSCEMYKMIHNLTSKALDREIKRNSCGPRHTLLWSTLRWRSNWPRGNEIVRGHYVIAWSSKWRRKRHKYVTNQRSVKNLTESASTDAL